MITKLTLAYAKLQYVFSSRKVHCEEVFSKVRFFQLQPHFVTERVIPDLAKGECVCKDEIKLAIIYQSSDKKKRQQLQEKLNPRYPSKVKTFRFITLTLFSNNRSNYYFTFKELNYST